MAFPESPMKPRAPVVIDESAASIRPSLRALRPLIHYVFGVALRREASHATQANIPHHPRNSTTAAIFVS